MTRSSNGPLPVLLVVYGRGAATALGILTTARRRCTVVFFGDLGDPEVAADLARLPETTPVVDTAGLTREQVCARAQALRPAGVVTFKDSLLRTAAAIAERCGLRFHDPATVEALVDKHSQRAALAAAGVQATICRRIRSAVDLRPALAATGVPAVLKPCSGAGSVNTCLVHDAEELEDRYAEFTTDSSVRGDYVLEEYLVGDTTVVGEFWGDYVSVESLVEDGRIHTTAITGKLPLAFPFRETGYFIPALLPDGLAQSVVRLEQQALRALGIRHGVTHTEIKFTPQGPRLIEVNGRLGGHVADILNRVAGVDLLGLAIGLALGDPDFPQALPRPGSREGGVAFQYFLSPPFDGLAPGGAGLVDDLYRIPGVDLVDARIDPSWRADWRAGTERLVGTVYGSADDFAGLRATVEALQQRMKTFWR
ncbi:acetyl-CoA carboxylase biotin carboxylase subunit family protein [Streptomyces sp. NPDC127112]|uniref:ATP-grasp domain-containing protein n=1 Tax=Streptomyces sp. NPDC127112 TaxID=3345364 RepID=UPI00362DDCD5